MVTIYLNSNSEEHDFTSFSNRFIKICNEHRNDSTALIFAFILYDLADAHIRKVLKDDEYWTSLNSISGRYLSVFTLNFQLIKKTRNQSFSDKPSTKYMTTIDCFQNPSFYTNKLIEEYFGQNINIKYPSVIFFQVDENNITDYTVVKLDESEIEKSFLELKHYISKLVTELKYIQQENKGNLKAIFNNTESIIQSTRWKKIAIKRFNTVIPIFRFGASIAKLGH